MALPDADRGRPLDAGPGDFNYVFYTLYRERPYRAFQRGEFPWRTLCLFGGYPLQADPQSALFDPGVWLTLFFSWVRGTPHVSMDIFHVESLIHLWIAAVLAYIFLRREVGNRWGALLGALVFAFGGYMTGYPILQVAKGESTAWLPLFLLGLRDLADGRIPRGLLLGGLGGALMILTGDPQIAFYILLGGTAYYAFRCAQSRLPWLPAVQRLGLLGLLLAGTTAVPLLPPLEYQQHSTRVRLGRPGLLLVRDPWYPDWTASVNGQPAPLDRADGVLMAVALPAGESEGVFRFRPPSFLVGAGISLVTIAFLWPWVLWRSARRP